MSENRLRRVCAALLAGCMIWMMIAATAEDAEGDVPALTEPPKVTDAPEATDPPKETDAPAATDPPKETDAPVVTDPPKATDAPAVTEPPKVTDAPVVTEPPKTTDAPVVTESPKVTDAPVVTDPPKVTDAPETTDPPKVTDVPEATEPPKTTDVPEATDPPKVTDVPEATDPPKETETPEATEEPTEEPTEVPTDSPENLFEIQGDVLVKYLGVGQNKTVTIPDGVRIIGQEAFMDDKILENLILPDSVEAIQDQAFAGCSSLKKVVLTSDSRLKIIGPKAFLNCRKINREFVEIAEEVAADAFEGVPEDTPTPEPEKTAAPSEEPAATDTPAPTDTPTPTPTPEPTANPYEEIEWEAPAPAYSSGGGTGKRQTHGRARTEMKHDYDQVNLSLAGSTESEPMQTLTLDGEELEVSLNSPEGEEAFFTVLLFKQTEEMSTDRAAVGDMLILRAEEAHGSENLYWRINGAALRKLSKSGVDYLAFLQGERIVAVPTEGFLAGWAYDELKSRGTAGRRFEYTLITGEEADPRWTVTVWGKTYELGADALSPMYLTGVETGTLSLTMNPKED